MKPKAPRVDEDRLRLIVERPPEGQYRVTLAVTDSYGTMKHSDFVVSPQIHQRLTERHSWDQYFYPALLRVTAV